MARQHARIIHHPFAASLQGALLDSCAEERRGEQLHLTLNIRALEHRAASELLERDGVIYERVQGNYVPAQLHFLGVSGLKRSDFFTSMASLPRNDPTPIIVDMLSWRQPERTDIFYLFAMLADNLMFFANGVSYERRSHTVVPVTLERNWSSPPPMSGRLVPRPKYLHKQFGGDPITLHIGTRTYYNRLFVGGLDVQGNERPNVDVVFNVGEEPGRWIKDEQNSFPDRWDKKGEGDEGMNINVIREEAGWVIDRLQKNQRVLVHCAAGLNRSSTICCAVLILLEGLTAEQALARVREHHPWARPDGGHWLNLRWLAKTNSP
jgi:Dual specificity phosphatase, catalytic domain